ncbi:hypothetical protein [Cupriavidus sp. L7L]|uniref:hypothetical protein n=1 Tax=Cupriavidus sp. L7L TaxID=2546443 RepID=UPI001054F333|nr:hypothetical protein [Cupriavidus sp. L7L]TDF62069.1 hypothetical protein E1J61_31720 [Cupriavidus sp. L7L]
MRSDLVQDGPPPIGANYLLAAVVGRSEGRLKLEGNLSPLAWKICDYLYLLAYRDRHSAEASSVSYHELMSLFRHGEGEEEVAAALRSLQTTLLEIDRGMDFYYSAQVVMTDELSPHLLRFRVPTAIQWFWAQLEAEQLN